MLTNTEENSADIFWREERIRIMQRNLDAASARETQFPLLRQRWGRRTTFLFICMDERLSSAENHLGLVPGEAIVFASNGTKITPMELDEIYGEKIRHSIKAHRQTAIYLVTHECGNHNELGCFAFHDGVTGQFKYLSELRDELAEKYPEAFVHALNIDTSKGQVTSIETDNRDDHLAELLSGPDNLMERPPENIRPSGYGIYVGNAYKAWVTEDNAYLRLSCLNPNLGEDLEAALISIERKPAVLHIDYPIYPDVELTGKCRRNIEHQIESSIKEGALKDRRDKGELKIMRTETEMESWRGMDVS